MGFVTAQYRKGYIVANNPYICIGNLVEIRRVPTENTKYTIYGTFNIHYSFEERLNNPGNSVIDSRMYTIPVNEIPNNMFQILYNMAKNEFIVVQDNL